MDNAALSDFATIGIAADRSTDQFRAEKPFSDSVRFRTKCCRKLDSQGKALRKSVKAAIKNAYGGGVELKKVDCFSLCPRGGQVLSTSGARGSRRLVIVQPDSDVEMAVEYLLRA